MTRTPATRSHVPPGLRDWLFEEAEGRRDRTRAVVSLFRDRGYREVVPPVVEYDDVLARGLGPDLLERTHRFFDTDGHLLALRSDFTPQIARIVATRLRDREPPLRLHYAGEVFRFDGRGDGRARAHLQAGCELVGGEPAAADAEVCELAIEAMRTLGVETFRVALGDVAYLEGVLDGLDLSEADLRELKKRIDARDPVALEQFLDEVGVDGAARAIVGRLPDLCGGPEVLERAAEGVESAEAREALDRLGRIHGAVSEAGLSEHLILDLGEVRGMAYYDGIVFRIYVPGDGVARGGGGRYDHLCGRYGLDRPAVGFSIDLDAVGADLAGEGAAGDR